VEVVAVSIKNMFESIIADGEDDEPETGEADGGMTDGGGLMAEEGGEDFGDLGGLDEEGGGGFGDDEVGQMDHAGANTDELEHRLDELENEVGSLSSTVSTVRTENEQISDSVEEVEENVRKLLDIYEMVTRGVNPFADDIDAGMGHNGVGDGSSFGLFADDGGQEGGGENLDEDVASADAEGFFDEDLVEDPGDAEPAGGDPTGGGDVDDVLPESENADPDEPDASVDEEFEDDFVEFDDAAEDGDDGGGKSFQELKNEYEDGDAEWDGEPASAADAGETAGTEADSTKNTEDGGLAEDELFEEVIEDDGFDAAGSDLPADPETDAPEPTPGATGDRPAQDEPATEVTPEQAESAAETSPAESPGAATPDQAPATDVATGSASAGTPAEETPYLATLPGGLATDLIVVEWLEFLTDASGYREAARAIDYYEDIDWIGPAVAEDLQEYLGGFDEVEASGDGLTIDDHTTSLEYISQLDGAGGASVALSKVLGGGGGRGLQR
jgi:flagellar protein FlaE